MVEISVCHST